MQSNQSQGTAKVVPPFLLRGGHRQTILGYYMRQNFFNLKGAKAVSLSLPDADQLALEVFENVGTKVVYLFHGLSGSSQSNYMQRMARYSLKHGWSVVLVNHRGCGPGAFLPHRYPYHSGRGEDISAVLAWGKQHFSSHQHICIGYSLSGSALLNLVTGNREKNGANTLPDFAISVNAPLDLSDASRRLVTGPASLYGFNFMISLRAELAHKRKYWKMEVPNLTFRHTILDFDEMYTAPRSNFSSASDYYFRCSTKNLLPKIITPSLLLTSQDDPIVNHEDYLKAHLNSNTKLHIEKSGGHLGYITKKGFRIRLDWLESFLGQKIREL